VGVCCSTHQAAFTTILSETLLRIQYLAKVRASEKLHRGPLPRALNVSGEDCRRASGFSILPQVGQPECGRG